MTRKPPREPWTPFDPKEDAAFVFALKALQAGTANEGQQQRALAGIIEVLAATYDLPFRPGGQDGDRATAFAAGKQMVGQQIVRCLNYDVRQLPAQTA